MERFLFIVGLITVLIGIFGGIPLAFSGDVRLILYAILVIGIGFILIGFSEIIGRLDKIIKLKD